MTTVGHSHDLAVRAAARSDAGTLAAIRAAAIAGVATKEYTDVHRRAWSACRGIADLAEAIEDGSEVVRVAVADGRVVGFATLREDVVWGVYVLPSDARRGVGAVLLRSLEAVATATGWGRLWAVAATPALPFYQALGYAEVEPEVFDLSDPVSGMVVRFSAVAVAKDLR